MKSFIVTIIFLFSILYGGILVGIVPQPYASKSIRSIDGRILDAIHLDSFIENQMDLLEIPGLSFAMINGDEIVYLKNEGFSNLQTMSEVSNMTYFDAASLSKTVFSYFSLLMVDQGIIELDIPLYSYLENQDIAYDERYKKITARMVLSHTSGFPNWRYLKKDGGYDPKARLRIDFEPGTQYQYSGEGYQYLAEVLAHQCQTDLEGLHEIMKEKMFQPLGLKESSFIWNDYLNEHRVDGYIGKNQDPGWSASARNPNFNAAASLQTNGEAYAKFLIALIDGRQLSKETQAEMLKIQSKRQKTKSKPGVKYGLGVIINDLDYGRVYSHSGDNGSSCSQFHFNKEQESAYVYFTNMEFKRKREFEENLDKFLRGTKAKQLQDH